MGREAGVVKARTCHECKGVLWSTARDLAAHAKLCKLATGAGLVLPGTIVPPDHADTNLTRRVTLD